MAFEMWLLYVKQCTGLVAMLASATMAQSAQAKLWQNNARLAILVSSIGSRQNERFGKLVIIDIA